MYTIEMTPTFADWLGELRDAKAKARIIARVAAARLGNLGDVEPVGSGVSERRVHVGPGYRVYFARTGKTVLRLDLRRRQSLAGQGH